MQTIENPLQNVSCMPNLNLYQYQKQAGGYPQTEGHGHVLLGKCLAYFLQGLQPGDDGLCLLFPLPYVCVLLCVTSEHHMLNEPISEKLLYCHMWTCLGIDKKYTALLFSK